MKPARCKAVQRSGWLEARNVLSQDKEDRVGLIHTGVGRKSWLASCIIPSRRPATCSTRTLGTMIHAANRSRVQCSAVQCSIVHRLVASRAPVSYQSCRLDYQHWIFSTTCDSSSIEHPSCVLQSCCTGHDSVILSPGCALRMLSTSTRGFYPERPSGDCKV